MTKRSSGTKKRRRFPRLAFWRRPKEKNSQKRIGEPPTKAVVVETQTDEPTIVEDCLGVDESETGEEEHVSATCPICFDAKFAEEMAGTSDCEHTACYECLAHYMTQEIREGRVIISCPQCAVMFFPHNIRPVLERSREPTQVDLIMSKYEDFTLRRALVQETDLRYCPAPDCSYGVIASNCAGCPRLVCQRQECGTSFCYHCKQRWHPNMTCDESRRLRGQNVNSSVNELSELGGRTEAMSSQEEIKPCPRCKTLVSKVQDGSCNHMTCFVCGIDFCWLCMREITDLHYLSPSGCTFWGKKPWSRRKRIMWQMGTLLAAPFGIALLAAVAAPALIVGIPAYVGHRVSERAYRSKHRRRLAVVGAVTLSAVTAPIVATVAVGVVVPVLFGYVYGVIPVTLCRGRGCKTGTRSNSGGQEEDEDGVGPFQSFGPFPSAARRLSLSSVLMPMPSITSSTVRAAAQVHVDGPQTRAAGRVVDVEV